MRTLFMQNPMPPLLLTPRRGANIFTGLLLAALCGLTGCLSRPALKEQTFVFNVPAGGATNTITSRRVLGIRSLQIAAPFAGRSLIYRTDEFSYVPDPYAEFLELPADELVAPVREWFRGSGNFQAVAESDSALKPDTLLEINLRQLYGDFRQLQHPLAILTLQATFFEAPNGVPAGVILQREYTRQIPLVAPSAAALMKGWDQALAEILIEISADLQSSQNHPPASIGLKVGAHERT